MTYVVIIQTGVCAKTEWEAPASVETPIKVPAIFDGTPPGINGYEITKLIYIIKQVENLLYGVIDTETKERVGKYIIEDIHYCVHTLAAFERNVHNTEYERQKLRELLPAVKEDFMKVALPFVEQARGVKAITLRFLEEWALKHNRQNSYLLHWSKEEDGKEVEAFYHNVTNFTQLEEFCLDLISFTSDLIQSCPRGWQQFLELQKKSHR